MITKSLSSSRLWPPKAVTPCEVASAQRMTFLEFRNKRWFLIPR